MKKVSLAKSEASLKILEDWYKKFEEKLNFSVKTCKIETSFGFTEVMVTGPEDGEPILLLHGALSGAPFPLGEMADLPNKRRFYAVNIPGQSVRAEAIRLDFKTNEYSQWLCEVLDQLSLVSVMVCGISWGGSVALQLAKYNPERVKGLLLLVPGSIVKSPIIKGLFGMGLPILRYKLFPTEENKKRAFKRLLTTEDEYWSSYMADIQLHYIVDFRVPPLVNPLDLKDFKAPVFVVAADKDISFPGHKLLKQSQKLFPNLIGKHLLKNSFHCPSTRPEDRKKFASLFDKAIDDLEKATVT